VTRTLECHNPAAADELVSSYPLDDAAAVTAAVGAAQRAAAEWAATPGPRRASVLEHAALLIEERSEEIAADMVREAGKLLAEARGEVLRAAAVLRFHAGEAQRVSGTAGEGADPGTIAFTRRRPLGVVGLITPWNFPIAIPAWKLAPALAAGNAVVMKPSSRAPGGALALAAAIDDAGLPQGALQVVIGGAEVGATLADDPRVAALSFTGSNAVGMALSERVAKRGVRFQAELGGNNPLIVCEDADLGHAVATAVAGAFGSAGQKCTATRRVIVAASVFDDFAQRFVAATEALVVGPGDDPASQVPPLIDGRAQREVLEGIEEARGKGAAVLTGGEDGGPELAGGHYVRPTILADVPVGTAVLDDEVFGPVCAIQYATDLDDAIRLANRTPYGLSASICTRDLGAAFAFVERIDAGMVHVNRPTPGADPHLPFGGVKGSTASGHREQGEAAIEFFTEGQTVYLQPAVPVSA
jgi:acyl-CoA reductase-like NAD-dependent aldehyde dehydrogenase